MERRDHWLGHCLGPTLAIGVGCWALLILATVVWG